MSSPEPKRARSLCSKFVASTRGEKCIFKAQEIEENLNFEVAQGEAGWDKPATCFMLKEINGKFIAEQSFQEPLERMAVIRLL